MFLALLATNIAFHLYIGLFKFSSKDRNNKWTARVSSVPCGYANIIDNCTPPHKPRGREDGLTMSEITVILTKQITTY